MGRGDDVCSVLGLDHGVVRLCDHTSLWAELYREEKERIMAVAGDLIVDLEHIGSTSIPGIKAKPVLDIMAGVTQLEKAHFCKVPLEGIGYVYLADAGIENDHVFGKNVPRTHYLHIVEYGGSKWTNHLYFRDRLRSDPALAQAYEELKEELSRKFSNNRAKYHDAKSKFINEVVAKNERYESG
jgi:GrpB-like predicted nucleotidyltransferase (UPF0157 family)